MGRHQVSAFKVFRSKPTRSNKFEQIKSGEHKVKHKTIKKHKKKSKDTILEKLCDKSGTSAVIGRSLAEESSMENKGLKIDRDSRKSARDRKKDLADSDVCTEQSSVKCGSKQRNRRSADRKDIEKVEDHKSTRITRSRSASGKLQTHFVESVSHKSVKRKRGDEVRKKVHSQHEVTSKKKKRKSSSERELSSSPDDEIVIETGSSEESDSETTSVVTEDYLQMIPEVVDVNLKEFTSSFQKQHVRNNSRYQEEQNKLRKSKSTSDIHRRGTSVHDVISQKEKSLTATKWKSRSRSSNENDFKIDSSKQLNLEYQNVDETASMSEKHSALAFIVDRCSTKVVQTENENTDKTKLKTKFANELAAASSSSYKSDNETELNISNHSSSGDVLEIERMEDVETLSDRNIREKDEEEKLLDKKDSAVDTEEKPRIRKRRLAFRCKDSGVLLLVSHPQSICLQGKLEIKVLRGSISIMQYNMSRETPARRVFSPSSNSLLTLETTSGISLAELKKKIKALSNDYSPDSHSDFGSEELFVLLKINKISSACLDYVMTVRPYCNLFDLNIDSHRSCNKVLKSVGLAVASADKVDVSVLSVSTDYTSFIDRWVHLIKHSEKAPVVLICAGKNCGKSTAARMLVNSALNVIKEVCFLECDIGQSELTPSCCVSLHTLAEPLLGPPFTHQREAESMCYFGGLTPSDNPSLYITQLTYVYESYKKKEQPPPLIINTMGWIEGLGLCLLMDTLQITKPDLVIQIDSSSIQNSLKPITPEYVARQPGWFFNQKPIPDSEEPKHELIKVDSLSDNVQRVILNWKPLDYRNMSLLAYLSAQVEPGITLISVIPHTVSWSEIGVHICHYAVKPSDVFCSLNASVVALCVADLSKAHRSSSDSPWFFDQIPVCQCLGLGIVRGIDMESKKLYIITPLSSDKLQNVNTVLKGKNIIPSDVFKGQKFFLQAHNNVFSPAPGKTSTGPVPYVDTVLMTQTAARYKSRRMSRR